MLLEAVVNTYLLWAHFLLPILNEGPSASPCSAFTVMVAVGC